MRLCNRGRERERDEEKERTIDKEGKYVCVKKGRGLERVALFK